VWGGGAPGPALARHRAGAAVLVWPGADPGSFAGANVPVSTVEESLGEDGRRAIEGAGRTWARLWSRVPLVDGKSFRELVTWNGASLLWLTEAFVLGEAAGPRCARTVETALRMLEAFSPDEIDAVGLGGPDAVLLARACTARGVLFHGPAGAARALPPRTSARPPRWTGLRAQLAPRTVLAHASDSSFSAAPPIVMLVGPAADPASLEPLVAEARAELGPVVVFDARTLDERTPREAWRAVGRATRELRTLHERLQRAPGRHEAWAHRGVSFADLARADLDAILLGRLPQAVRRLETAAALLAETGGAAVVLPGWPRDDRRGLLTAAARRGLPTLVLRSGAPDPDDVERDDGGPRPTATVDWTPGADPRPVLARLAESTGVLREPA